jgi:hypothetical protein
MRRCIVAAALATACAPAGPKEVVFPGGDGISDVAITGSRIVYSSCDVRVVVIKNDGRVFEGERLVAQFTPTYFVADSGRRWNIAETSSGGILAERVEGDHWWPVLESRSEPAVLSVKPPHYRRFVVSPTTKIRLAKSGDLEFRQRGDWRLWSTFEAHLSSRARRAILFVAVSGPSGVDIDARDRGMLDWNTLCD